MKYALFFLLLFGFQTAQSQIVYLSAEEDFSIIGDSSQKAFKAVWLKFVDTESAEIALKSGKRLNRTFKKGLANPYYIIINDKIRFRPNMAVLKADTVIVQRQKQNTITNSSPSAIHNELKILSTLEYEWEKTEKAKWICSNLNPSCTEIEGVLSYLQYDASRVEVINTLPSSLRKQCISQLQKTVSAPYRATLKLD